jgi:uncharacterized protein DUF1615
MKPWCRMWIASIALTAGACSGERPANQPVKPNPADSRALIDRSLPRSVADRSGWVADIYAAFTALDIPPTKQNVCAVVAVTAQESGFQVDPFIPGLPAMAWGEIDKRAGHADVPVSVLHEVLRLNSPNGQSYTDRIDHAHTEKELSDIFEDFTGSIPFGRSMFASLNPIRTRGPMQVNVAFAEQFASTHHYPYPVKVSIGDELFTRRGSVYFGTAHLLAYSPPYDRFLYRFADFNAGQFASRNAAFQLAVSGASGSAITADGALLPHDPGAKPGDTELAARALATRLDMTDGEIRSALEEGRRKEFERTRLYTAVFNLAEHAQGRPLPRAAIPRIKLEGPKLSRTLSTEWYANRVDGRFKECLAR